MTRFGLREWLTILIIGLLLISGSVVFGFWWFIPIVIALEILLLQFFRDPDRNIPDGDEQLLAPSDGTISSVHEVGHFEPFDGPAVCVRIFMSVFNVHVNRNPCHGVVGELLYKEGEYLNTLKAISAERNEQLTTIILDEEKGNPVAAVRQIAGAIARTIVNPLKPGDQLTRGERFGMIKFGSTTELYLPAPASVKVMVEVGDKVKAGASVLARRI